MSISAFISARCSSAISAATTRLDFTVVGPAVNEVARIAAMCRSVERNVLLSQAFADAMARLERGRLVRSAAMRLRGVERPQELFTLDPFWTA